MTKAVLKCVAVVLVLLVAVLFVLYTNRTDPYGSLPGKRIEGDVIFGQIDDWSFAQQYRRVTIEVRPDNPYSVFAGYFLLGSDLYISSAHSRWAQFLREDPEMRIRLGGEIYPVRATQVEEPVHLKEAHQGYTGKYPNRTMEEAAGRWFFQLESY